MGKPSTVQLARYQYIRLIDLELVGDSYDYWAAGCMEQRDGPPYCSTTTHELALSQPTWEQHELHTLFTHDWTVTLVQMQ